MNNKISTSYPTEMYFNNNYSSTPEEIVERFVDFFESNYEVDEEQWSFPDVYTEPPTHIECKEVDITMSDIEISI